MSPVAERIYQSIKQLIKQKDAAQNHLKQYEKELDSLRHLLHKSERATVMHVASPSGNTPSDIQFADDMRQIMKLKREIKSKEEEVKSSSLQASQLVKQIEHYTFWMQYADTVDESKQKEAEKVIFG